jgi:hypothetical protein
MMKDNARGRWTLVRGTEHTFIGGYAHAGRERLQLRSWNNITKNIKELRHF